LVTADLGNDSALVVWDSESGTPVKTVFNPNPGGVRAVAMSDDSEYIATLGDMLPEDKHQTVYIWKRESESNEPVAALQEKFTPKGEVLDFDFIVFKREDPHKLAMNGKKAVYFLSWNENQREMDYYRAKDKGHTGNYTMTAFVNDGAVTATDEGKIVVWGKSVFAQDVSRPDKLSAIKVVQVGPEAKKGKEGAVETNPALLVSVLIAQDEWIVAGFGDGSVKFYDQGLKVKMWFEKLKVTGEIKSISFSLVMSKDEYDKDNMLEPENSCPNFIIADNSGTVYPLRSDLHYQLEDRAPLNPILKGHNEAVVCIATHPAEPILAIATYKGSIQFWNYETKEEAQSEYSVAEKTHSPWVMTYTPKNDTNLFLMVGCTDGGIKAIPQHPQTKQQVTDLKIKDQMLSGKRFYPEQIIVTKDARCMATRDNDFCVSLFRFEVDDSPDMKVWHFCGKCRTHLLPITSIAFTENPSGKIKWRLFSIGEDMKLLEYDVMNSTESEGLKVKDEFLIEQESIPSSLLEYPNHMVGSSEYLMWFNSNYKVKLWDTNQKICVKTALGPVYAREVVKVKLMSFKESETGEDIQYLAYATESKVIGLIKLPLDGNPHKTMGLIAHSGKIADICISHDNRYMFTCGGKTFRYKKGNTSVEGINCL
jgi:WD40 repeat protein